MYVSHFTEMFIKYNRQNCDFSYDKLIQKSVDERRYLTDKRTIFEYQEITRELFEMKFNKISLKDVR